MMVSPSLGFQSESLRFAVESVREVLENHEKFRDRVSEDILCLEKYLSENKLNQTFRFSCGSGFVAPDDGQYVRASLESSGSATGEVHEEAIIWAPDPKGRYRLFYELCKWEGFIDVDMPGGPVFHDSSTLVRELKPLIETPFDTRKAMSPRLAEFIKALASHLAIDVAKSSDLSANSAPF